MTTDEPLEKVRPGTFVEMRNLTVHIAAVRKLFGQATIATALGRDPSFTTT